MASNTLKTRIQLKYDVYSKWLTSSFVPLLGEVCIAEIPNDTSNSGLIPPAIGIKVGDGTHTFSQLPWIQGVAGDVYAWAKAAQKPEYAASEITGLQTYVEEHSVSTNTKYQIVENENVYTLQSRDNDTGNWTNVSTINLANTVSRIQTLEGLVGATAVSTQISDAITNLNLGDAAQKGVDTSVSDSTTSNNLPTSEAVKSYVASKFGGLSGAMHFIGSATVDPDDNTFPAIANYTTPVAGDVVLRNQKEYVWNGTQWQLFGAEGDYALNTVTITGTNGLTGGGAISSNQTIEHYVPTSNDGTSTLGSASDNNGRTYIQTIATDNYGHITSVTVAAETVTDTRYELVQDQTNTNQYTFREVGAQSGTTFTISEEGTTYTFAEGSTNGAFSVTPSNTQTAQSVPVHGLTNIAFGGNTNYLTQGNDDYLVFTCGTAETLIDDGT